MKQSKTIGLIGGCGTGKSEIARILKSEYHAFVIIADEIGHDILENDEEVQEKLVKTFGNQILDFAGRIDRFNLGKIVFSDSFKLQELNQIMHPVMKVCIGKLIENAKNQGRVQLIVLEAAVMIEAGFIELVDEVWLIRCDLETRISRLIQYRNYTRKKALNIIASQPDEALFAREADFVLDNSYSLEETYKQIKNQLTGFSEEFNEI